MIKWGDRLVFAFAVAAVLAALMVCPALAKVSGPCANCHTMHNSQDGDEITEFDVLNRTALTKTNCLGCHSATDPSTAFDPVTGAPIVYNTGGAPTYGAGSMGLSAGNFYWVEHDGDNKGHNVIETNPDDVLTTAPGGTFCGQAVSCHTSLSNAYGISRQGCSKCHMLDGMHAAYPDPVHSYPLGYHHKDDSDLVLDSLEEGWFRFLSGHQNGLNLGVTGIEDPDWGYTSSATDHNEYLAGRGGGQHMYSGGLFSAGSCMTGFCTACHPAFHVQIELAYPHFPWRRHPADQPIPNKTEYINAYGAAGSGVGSFDPLMPVARPLASLTGVSPDVTIGQDSVMCLTCHKAHGSPYPDALTFDYDAILAGGGTDGEGCFKCHTKKDDGS